MNKLCSCGFPQSSPIPHEHDRTERENQIIEHYEDVTKDLYEACKKALDFFVEFDVGYKVISGLSLQLREALAKAEGKTEAKPSPWGLTREEAELEGK